MASNSSTAMARVSYRQQQLHNSSHGHGSSLNSSSRNVNGNVNDSNGTQQQANHSARAKAPVTRRSVTPTSRSVSTNIDFDNDPGRVRVAVRLRPRNAEDILSDADFADFVELQPELKRLKLRKNNWSSESYRFDEVFTETASQKRIYEVVAKPVVESVLSGYNGTVMAYGQTGTGKTYTLGRLGKDDASERGIMVRAFEDIIANTSPTSDSVEVSYLQLYMESVQDLLAPEKTNLPIHEDPKTGEVSLAGAEVVKIRDLDHFLELLQIGEANRHAANTKLNTESSRSHAILMVYVRRYIHENAQDQIAFQEKDTRLNSCGGTDLPVIRKSKLLIVDLAGSERLDKSGFEGHLMEEAKFINLSLTSLGKCINALAENSPHIPTRDSKLTRLLRDSFGGAARTSLIVTIGPSARHHGETTSTIMFGQRAMKVVNMVKLKEEFDYESLCRKLEAQVDHLTAEIERQQKLRDNDEHNFEKQLKECVDSFSEENKNLLTRSEFLENENGHLKLEMNNILTELNCLKDHSNLMRDKVAQLEMSLKHSQKQEVENTTYQNVLADTTQMYEMKIAELIKQVEDDRARTESAEQQFDVMKKLLSDHQKTIQQHEMENSKYQKELADTSQMFEKKVGELIKQVEDEHVRFECAAEQLDLAKKFISDCQNSMQEQNEVEELRVKLQEMHQLHNDTLVELRSLKSEYDNVHEEKATLSEELYAARQRLLVEEKQRKTIEHELVELKKTVPEGDNDIEDKKSYMKENIGKGSSALRRPMGLHNSNTVRETLSGQRASIAKICEEVGLQKILQLLTSEDVDVQIHAVKVIANLAAEDINQEKIVEDGGLDALLMLLQSSQNTTILRVASGAIANLAMNEINQGLIMSKGGAQLLAGTASKTDDPQTLRMVAGALANLCGNERLHTMLKEDGGIKALLGMIGSWNNDVIAQVARGVANFAKCESRGNIQGQRKGPSLLMEYGTLEWLIANSKFNSASTRRHIELAVCHLAQNEDNARDFISTGGLKELVRISVESNREDIRNLAKKTLKLSREFQAEMNAE
ncbi:Armadillo/beta-catenin repeat family protein / kinesin motor family protein isoform 1 [Tripterygium wilfordii]|uniref:Armadillo/beta-catenin repeat family protein / kinesin motor family protein isoform 1 n=1 Tax=Tripterygium wilfordii TaxID=458696 RepID=A0A7J7D8E1_TRIWF|nr:Armadillo/beta-catenin repeat family protein / kinesin motor family protein isoform 1 [Tripterygium wilfordii]